MSLPTTCENVEQFDANNLPELYKEFCIASGIVVVFHTGVPYSTTRGNICDVGVVALYAIIVILVEPAVLGYDPTILHPVVEDENVNPGYTVVLPDTE